MSRTAVRSFVALVVALTVALGTADAAPSADLARPTLGTNGNSGCCSPW